MQSQTRSARRGSAGKFARRDSFFKITRACYASASKTKRQIALRPSAFQRRKNGRYCLFLTASLQQTYSEAPEAAAAAAAFFCHFLCADFFVAFFADEPAAGAHPSRSQTFADPPSPNS